MEDCMPSIDHLRYLYAYHFDTTVRLMDLAQNLGEADYNHDPGYGRGSIHALFLHILNADRGWRTGLETGKRPPSLALADHVDLASLREVLAAERGAWEKFLTGLTAQQVDKDAEMSAGSGYVRSFPRWKVLHHVLFHGMQHQAEIAQLLSEKGQKVGDIDFFFYSQ
jgi:uncharacterized damage-inducible protein DinB